MASALVLMTMAGPGAIAADRGSQAAQVEGEDTTPPRVHNKKLNNPEVSDLLDRRVLRLEIRCNEPCLVDAQLVLGRRVLGGDLGRVRAGRERVVLRLGLTKRGRRIVRREEPRRLEVGIRAEDLAGNVVETDHYQSRR